MCIKITIKRKLKKIKKRDEEKERFEGDRAGETTLKKNESVIIVLALH